jgi:hypothetical protein
MNRGHITLRTNGLPAVRGNSSEAAQPQRAPRKKVLCPLFLNVVHPSPGCCHLSTAWSRVWLALATDHPQPLPPEEVPARKYHRRRKPGKKLLASRSIVRRPGHGFTLVFPRSIGKPQGSNLADTAIIPTYDSRGNHLRAPVSAHRQTNGRPRRIRQHLRPAPLPP